LIETNIIKPANSFQVPRNRILRAAVFVAQVALLLRQESVESHSGRDASHLRTISEGLQRLVPALQRLGRVTKPEVPPEHIASQFVPAGDLASRDVVL
jgi:hypothetical protein